MFAFFLESAFLGLFLFGEKRLGPRAHWLAAFAVFLGSWMSGYFIIADRRLDAASGRLPDGADGSMQLASFWGLVLNPWALWQYAHNMMRSGGHRPLRHGRRGRILSARRPARRTTAGYSSGSASSPAASHASLQIFPTGDLHGKYMVAASAGHACRDGRPVSHREGSADRSHRASRTSRRKKSTIPWPCPTCSAF